VAYATDVTDDPWRLVWDLFDRPVAGRSGADPASPHGRRDLVPGPHRLLLADLGFEPLVKGIARRHEVTVTVKGWRKPSKPKGFKPIRPLWKVEDCFAQLGRWRRLARSYEATTDSATWLRSACVGYLLAPDLNSTATRLRPFAAWSAVQTRALGSDARAGASTRRATPAGTSMTAEPWQSDGGWDPRA
jgi:transposase